MAFVYILKSFTSGRYYIGSTINLKRRLEEHEKGKVVYTKPQLPVILVFKQECLTYKEARFLENRLKKFKRKDFLEKIIRDGNIKCARSSIG